MRITDEQKQAAHYVDLKNCKTFPWGYVNAEIVKNVTMKL